LKVGAGAETNGFGSGNTEKGKKRKELGQTKEQWYGLINDNAKRGDYWLKGCTKSKCYKYLHIVGKREIYNLTLLKTKK
jgi:hypothetical protein